MKRILLIAGLVIATAGVCQVQAGDTGSFKSSKNVEVDEFPFRSGDKELQLLGGAFFSFTPDTSHRKTINYAFETARFGYMVTNIHGDGFFRGNFEMLLEGFGGEVFRGPCAGLAGGSLLFRYNFVQPGARIIPYFQAGGGALWNDIWKDRKQEEVGQAFEFNLQAHVGVHFFLSRNAAVTLEGGYTHISNADLADRNQGLDSLGALAGFSLFF